MSFQLTNLLVRLLFEKQEILATQIKWSTLFLTDKQVWPFWKIITTLPPHRSISNSELSLQLSLCSASRSRSFRWVSDSPLFAKLTSASFCCNSCSCLFSWSSFLSNWHYVKKKNKQTQSQTLTNKTFVEVQKRGSICFVTLIKRL